LTRHGASRAHYVVNVQERVVIGVIVRQLVGVGVDGPVVEIEVNEESVSRRVGELKRAAKGVRDRHVGADGALQHLDGRGIRRGHLDVHAGIGLRMRPVGGIVPGVAGVARWLGV